MNRVRCTTSHDKIASLKKHLPIASNVDQIEKFSPKKLHYGYEHFFHIKLFFYYLVLNEKK